MFDLGGRGIKRTVANASLVAAFSLSLSLSFGAHHCPGLSVKTVGIWLEACDAMTQTVTMKAQVAGRFAMTRVEGLWKVRFRDGVRDSVFLGAEYQEAKIGYPESDAAFGRRVGSCRLSIEALRALMRSASFLGLHS